MHNAAYIAMGTNMPFRTMMGIVLLQQAVREIRCAGIEPHQFSSVWRTEPWPRGADQPDYFNAVIAADAGELAPQELFARLQVVERAFGRERRERWGARTLDLDIISMDGFQGEFGELVLPHPRMHERVFVLAPLAEVAPGWRHPELGLTATEMLAGVEEGARYRKEGALVETGQG